MGKFGKIVETHSYACVTDYQSVYADSYYAHAQGVTSYGNNSFARDLIQEASTVSSSRSFLDIGGGNGSLADAISSLGGACLTIDAQDRESEGYRQFDLSRFDKSNCGLVKKWAADSLNDDYIATCFDVAEHIDPEHIASLLLNLNGLTQEYLIISISTRPSSMGNRYHSTVIPASTWKIFLEEAGFEVQTTEDLCRTEEANLWSEPSENLWAVSHWQKVNPFREHLSHQAYFRCRKINSLDHSVAFEKKINEIIDIDYRKSKRLSKTNFPKLIYHVAFWQDWAFVRSIMEAWPRDRLHVILRSTFLLQPLLYLARNYLKRVNLQFSEYYTVDEGVSILEQISSWKPQLFLNCTTGLPHPIHLSAARVASAARAIGIRTLCVQHGLTVPEKNLPGTDCFWVWGPEFFSGQALAEDSDTEIGIGGSPKLIDAQLDQRGDVFANRFGAWSKNFERRVLIALGLHDNSTNQNSDSAREWVKRLCREHNDTLFVIKPHPNDVSIYKWKLNEDNALLVDDIILTVMDWPISRLLKSVDLVVTPPSTLILEALAASTPVAVYGSDQYEGPMNDALEALLEVSHKMGRELLPQFFTQNALPDQIDCLISSSSFIARLTEIEQEKTTPKGRFSVPSRIADWANSLVPEQFLAYFTERNSTLEDFIKTPPNPSATTVGQDIGEADLDYNSLLDERNQLRKSLRHARQHPWKYIGAALKQRLGRYLSRMNGLSSWKD